MNGYGSSVRESLARTIDGNSHGDAGSSRRALENMDLRVSLGGICE